MVNRAVQESSQDVRWQRISPIAILYFVVSSLKQLVSNAIYLLPAFAISYSTLQDNPLLWLFVFAGFFSLIVIRATLEYWFYTYRIGTDYLEIRSGIVAKTHLNLPFNRIQNVTLEQPIYYQINHICCVLLDTAGSARQEAKIVALSEEYAQQLKRQILDHAPDKSSDQTNLTDQADDKDEVLLNSRSLHDLVLHGITNNRVWIIIGVLAPFYDKMATYLTSILDSYNVEYRHYFDTQTQDVWQLSLMFLGVFLLVVLIITLISVLGSVVIFFNFTLSKKDDRYIRRNGLFTRQEVTMRQSRIQVIALKQDWLDVLLKRVNLAFKQNSSGSHDHNDKRNNSTILVPSVTPNQAISLAQDALPQNALERVQYEPISRRFILRQCLHWLLPLTFVLAAVAHIYIAPYGVWLVLPLSILLFVAIFYRWKRWGYAMDENYFYIRNGIVGINYYCFPLYKVQQTRLSQSYFMRKIGLANMQYILASGSMSVPFVERVYASTMLNKVLTQISFQKRSWM